MTEVVKIYYITNDTNNVEGTIEIESDSDGKYLGTGTISSQIFTTKLNGISTYTFSTSAIQES